MVSPQDLTSYILRHLRYSLHTAYPDDARILRMTRAAGTEFAGASFAGTVNSLLISTVTVLPC